jgi:hypothetical protein
VAVGRVLVAFLHDDPAFAAAALALLRQAGADGSINA